MIIFCGASSISIVQVGFVWRSEVGGWRGCSALRGWVALGGLSLRGNRGDGGGLLGSVDCRFLQRLHHKTKLDFSEVLVVSQTASQTLCWRAIFH